MKRRPENVPSTLFYVCIKYNSAEANDAPNSTTYPKDVQRISREHPNVLLMFSKHLSDMCAVRDDMKIHEFSFFSLSR